MRKRGGTRRMKLKTRKSRRNKSRNRKIYGGTNATANANQNQTAQKNGSKKVNLLIEIAKFLKENKENLSKTDINTQLNNAFLLDELNEDYSNYTPEDYIGVNTHITLLSGGIIILQKLLNRIATSSEVAPDLGKRADMYNRKINEVFA